MVRATATGPGGEASAVARPVGAGGAGRSVAVSWIAPGRALVTTDPGRPPAGVIARNRLPAGHGDSSPRSRTTWAAWAASTATTSPGLAWFSTTAIGCVTPLAAVTAPARPGPSGAGR